MSYDPGQGGQPQGWQGQPQYPPPGQYGQQSPTGWGPAPGPGQTGGFGGPTGTPQQKSAFASLFDFSFSSFATPGLIKLLYAVGAALLVVAWLGYTIFGFVGLNTAAGFAFLLLGAVVVLFYLAFLRLILEFYYAVVRMSEDIHNRR